MKIAMMSPLLAISLALPLHAQKPAAKISEATARGIALRRVAGTVKAHELETEGGKLIYSYDIAVTGKSGIDEVHVDAITGKVLSVVHETPNDEKNEAAKEASENKRLAARARISEPAARATALARVPNSKVESFELEEENGKLIYSYDLTVSGKPGFDEVHVDAVTGKILAVEHEKSAPKSKTGK